MRAIVALSLACLACASPPQPAAAAAAANAGIDSLNARLVQVYRNYDAAGYAALFTDSAVFEWPAFNTVRGPAGMAAMARSNWTGLRAMDLRLIVAARRLAADHATEFGAFQQSWSDSSGARMTEFGRYVTFLARNQNGTWLIDRFFGFEDSTRSSTPPGGRRTQPQ